MQKIMTIALATGIALTTAAPMFAASSDLSGIYKADQQSTIDKRRKPRVPGGSGCDDPRDIIEHPECAG